MPLDPPNQIDTFDTDDDGQVNEDQRPIQSSPRDQREAFQTAAETALSGGDSRSGETASSGVQARNLKGWATDCGKIIGASAFKDLRLVSDSTSEHKVFHCKETDRAIKHTWPGVFGQIPAPKDGHLDRCNASPSEYLTRMALQLQVFGGDINLEGVFISDQPGLIIGQPVGEPSLVINQQWYERSAVATNEIIHDFLVQEGFRSVPSSYFGWYRPDDRIVIVDAKPDNFILTKEGLIPIDLQMIQFTEEQMIAAGLTSDRDSPVIFLPRS